MKRQFSNNVMIGKGHVEILGPLLIATHIQEPLPKPILRLRAHHSTDIL